VASYVGALLRRRAGFVVTPKGDEASPDRLETFRHGLMWAAFYAVLLASAPLGGHVDQTMWLWPALNLAICLTPTVIWLTRRRPGRTRPGTGRRRMTRQRTTRQRTTRQRMTHLSTTRTNA
jgi:hypothetical protein